MTSTTFVKDVDYERIAPLWKFWADPKYRLLHDCCTQTPFRPEATLEAAGGLVRLPPNGLLFVGEGYESDAASGPTIDTPSVMRASMAVHDPLYDLLRDKDLPMEARWVVDKLLRDIMLKDGAWPCRADYYLWGVSRFAAGAARARGRATG